MTSGRTSPLRFLFTTTPGYGHWHPLIPLARALDQAGHTVAFAGRAFLEPRLTSAGFPFFPIGSDRAEDPEFIEFAKKRAEIPSGFEMELFIYTNLFSGIIPRLNLPGLVEVVRAWKPDMLIREAAEYSAVLAAELANIPHATVAFMTALKGMRVFERHTASRLDPIRVQWGLPPDPDLQSLYRHLYLAYTPPTFGVQDVRDTITSDTLPNTTRFIRPQVFDNPKNESLPAWFDDLPAQPTVYLTMGTEVNNEPEFYPSVLETIITGLRDLPINLIVTLGRDRDPADFGNQPANVHIEQYIPQSLLLPRCDLMVMHGGSNTLIAALDVGLPFVIVPLIADQFFNAEITERIGLGRVVSHSALTLPSIRAAVQDMLSNSQYKQTARRLQSELQALPTQQHAVSLIEQVTTQSKP